MSFIRFQQTIPDGPYVKTRVWDVESIGNGTRLGRVCWRAPWRRYSFYPTMEREIVLDATCLRDIADFCDEQTREHNERCAKKRKSRLVREVCDVAE